MGRYRAFCLLVCAGWLSGATVLAQPSGASIDGDVVDRSRAAVAGASISLRSTSGGVRRTTTDGTGRFRFNGLNPGTYELRVEREGFSPFTTHVTTRDASIERVNITLEIAPIAETVNVDFTAPRSQTALKYEASIPDQPRSVTSYTSGFMRAVEARRTEDLFPYITGVTRAGDTAFDFTIRGVRSREPNNILVDGLPGLPARFGSPSLSAVERIDVMRGPASAAYGQIQPGGLINIVRKKPRADRINLVDVRLGSVASPQRGSLTSAQIDGDFSGKVDAGGHYLYRLVFSYDQNDSYRTAVDSNNVLVTPMLTWVPNPRTALELSLEYRRERAGYDDGLVAPGSDVNRIAPLETRYQEPEDFMRENGLVGTMRFVRELTSQIAWTSSWRGVVHDDYRHGFENFQVAQNLTTLQRRDREQETKRRYNYFESNIKVTKSTGPLLHTLLVGATGGYELRAPNQIVLATSPTLNVNLYAPTYGAARPRAAAGTYRRNSFLNGALYVQDHVALSPAWTVVVGLRGDTQRAEYVDMRTTFERTTHPSAWSPTTGVVFTPEARWSLYSNYSTSFAPANPEAQDANGQNHFEPESGREVEGGVRTRFGPVESTAAVFSITRRNVLRMVGGGVTTQSSEERSDGFEWELRGAAAGVELIAGYAYTEAEVTRDAVAVNVNSRVPNVPAHGANVWGRYEFSRGPVRGLTVALGVVYRGARAGSMPTATGAVLELPGYVRTDVGASYQIGPLDVRLHATNLTNRRYYDSALSAISVQPGTPRQLVLSFRTQF